MSAEVSEPNTVRKQVIIRDEAGDEVVFQVWSHMLHVVIGGVQVRVNDHDLRVLLTAVLDKHTDVT